MEKKVKEELDKLIIIGNESGMLRTSTVKQLLNDLNKKTEEDFEDAVQYVERILGLIRMILKINCFWIQAKLPLCQKH